MDSRVWTRVDLNPKEIVGEKRKQSKPQRCGLRRLTSPAGDRSRGKASGGVVSSNSLEREAKLLISREKNLMKHGKWKER